MRSDTHYPDLSVAVVVAVSARGELGGAERLYDGLLDGLKALGCKAERIEVIADESSFNSIEAGYRRCQALDLKEFDVVISTKAPTYALSHPRHVLYLLHTTRVFYDRFEEAFPNPETKHYTQRQKIHALDFEALKQVRARFAIGYEVAGRLKRWNGIGAQVLHPPLALNRFRQGEYGNYFFIPGRLHKWKRLDLLIQAVIRSNMPLRLVIAGTGEAEDDLKALAGTDPRIEFRGHVDDGTLIDLYGNALAVPFVPIQEDYGYITVEAFASGKAVITCIDSGEPVRFVRHGLNGLICEPTPKSLTLALERLYLDKQEARNMGQRAKEGIASTSWKDVARQLVNAGLDEISISHDDAEMRVAVLDMQPIDPPVGGGRMRLLGLYHNLGPKVSARYIGSYDWPGERYRRHYLSDNLEEIDIPLSEAHHRAAYALSLQCGGKTVIDVAFAEQGVLSPEYLKEARSAIEWADVIVFSHPWIYPLVSNVLGPLQLIIYDSQNVEGLLRVQFLDEKNPAEKMLLRGVVQTEYDLGRRADVLLACSHTDRERFARIYDLDWRRLRVFQNGTFVFSQSAPSDNERAEEKEMLGLAGRSLVVFLGSEYGPNNDAARYVVGSLAPTLPEVVFAIIGSCCNTLNVDACPQNVKALGLLEEKDKRRWMRAADVAINPLATGSGTSIKMFDYMAAGLPIVTTEIGARGIASTGEAPLVLAELDRFTEAVGALLDDPDLKRRLASRARHAVESFYAWERISPELGLLLRKYREEKLMSPPYFSVVIPSYQRHNLLDQLMVKLQRQRERDFEVIVIDQSAERWPNAGRAHGFRLQYVHSEVKGAVKARNLGGCLASGKVIAFTDDDCQPTSSWLENARRWFDDVSVIGVEGLIRSDHLGDPEWRQVTNIGFEGLGFMTANLFVRNEIFQMLDGFDLSFDDPHFREDTDFGWRMQRYGKVPYAADVEVYHPAQCRNIQRESQAERSRFFEKDALLLRKHPEKYRDLFYAEKHFKTTPGFFENLERGASKYQVDLPSWILSERRRCAMRD